MKTQCPMCKKIQEVPDEYRRKEIKCPDCTTLFIAESYKEPPPRPIPPVVIARLESLQTKSGASLILGRLLQITGGIGIFLAVLINFGIDQSITDYTFVGGFIESKYSDYEQLLMDILNTAMTTIEVFLCVIIIGIGSLVKKSPTKPS